MLRKPWIALFVASCMVLPLSARKTTGTIHGVVVDAVGAVVHDAEVAVTNQGSGVQRTVKTSSTSEYVVTDLDPGIYQVSVRQKAFKEFVATGVKLDTFSDTPVNATLAQDSVNEQVTYRGQHDPD